MRVGIIVPQGWTGEYDGWDPARAWARTVAVAHGAEAFGFERFAEDCAAAGCELEGS